MGGREVSVQGSRTRVPRRVRSGVVVVLALVVSVFCSVAQAAPGDLDPTFSGDGKERTDFDLGISTAAATVVQPDGKIVAVGGTYEDFAVARYNADGSLDTSFSGDGRQTTNFTPNRPYSVDRATGVALQGDGKIVVAGRVEGDDSSDDFALARYNPNGSLDTSFSGDGKQTTDFDGTGAEGVAIQADGKIVAVGSACCAHSVDFAVARYNADGSLDTTFSGDGKQTTDFGGGELAHGMVIQPDGKIVAVGAIQGGNFALARYNPNGTLDASFSGDGKQTTDLGGADHADGVAIQADGNLVVVGVANEATTDGGDFGIARYTPDGSLDPSFSDDGRRTTNFGASEEAYGVAIQADGNIVAVGRTSGPGFADFALARYTPTGTLDTGFSGDGVLKSDFGASDEAHGVAIQGDGAIVAVGQATGAGFASFALARYNPDGTPDTTFSDDGSLMTAFGGFNGATGVAIQSDGKVVVAGGAGSVVATTFALARYNPDGSLDTSFSDDGMRTTNFGANAGANGVVVQPDGKIVAVGRAGGGGFAIARYNPDGSLDTSFSDDGKQTAHGGSGEAKAVALQASGKIVVVGSGGGIGLRSNAFVVARLNPNGALDTTFSDDGIQASDFGPGRAEARGVAVQSNGKVVAVGFAGAADFAIARYYPNGSLDMTFSGDGMLRTDIGGSDFANGVVVQPDGKIVAAGIGGSGFALTRYNPNGSLDTTFSGDGKQTTDFGEIDFAHAVALQGNGKIVAVGGAATTCCDPARNFALARYKPNGWLDTSFSGNGKQTTNFGGSDEANGVAIQSDGGIVAAGVGGGIGTSSDFVLARYQGD
jgi:uncharacterized delta-60 repeat protein